MAPSAVPWYRFSDDRQCLLLELYIQPGASRTEVAGLHDGLLKIRVAAAAVDNQANEALIRFLKKALAVPASRVALKHGAQGRRKTVEIRNPGRLPETLLPQTGKG